MSFQILISHNAIKRYRQRTLKDPLREERSDRQIRAIIFNSIISHKTWPTLEKLASEGVKAKTTLIVDVRNFRDPMGKYKVVIVPSININGGYFVQTYKNLNQ